MFMEISGVVAGDWGSVDIGVSWVPMQSLSVCIVLVLISGLTIVAIHFSLEESASPFKGGRVGIERCTGSQLGSRVLICRAWFCVDSSLRSFWGR